MNSKKHDTNIAAREEKLIELGTKLKDLREKKHLTIDDVVSKTKIQHKYLEEIEDGDLSSIPKGPYKRSFLKQYCDLLNAPRLWNAYDDLTKTSKPDIHILKEEGNESGYSLSPKVFRQSSFVGLYILILLSLLGAGWITWEYRGEITDITTTPMTGGTASLVAKEETDISEASEDTVSKDTLIGAKTSVTVSIDMSKPQSNATADLSWMDGSNANRTVVVPSAADASSILTIKASGGYAWVRVTQGETKLFEKTLSPNESKAIIPAPGKPVKVKFGSPLRSSAKWKGKIYFPIGLGGRPATRFFNPDGSVTEE